MIDDLHECHKKAFFSNDETNSCNEKHIVQSSSSNQDQLYFSNKNHLTKDFYSEYKGT